MKLPTLFLLILILVGSCNFCSIAIAEKDALVLDKVPMSESIGFDNKTHASDNFKFLESRVDCIEKNFSGVWGTMQTCYGHIITAILAIAALFVGGGIFNTFFYVKNRINKTEEGLRGEIASQLRETKKEFEKNLEVKVNKIEYDLEDKNSRLRGYVFDSIARVYQDDNPAVSGIWFARCIKEHTDIKDVDESWIKNRLKWVAEALDKSEKIVEPKIIKEYQDIIEKIDGVKFKEEKEKVEKALKDNLNKNK